MTWGQRRLVPLFRVTSALTKAILLDPDTNLQGVLVKA
jgi:hypothetical protein